MWRRPACQTLSKALDISSATARVAPDLLKALAILSDTTVRRSNFGKFVWKIPGFWWYNSGCFGKTIWPAVAAQIIFFYGTEWLVANTTGRFSLNLNFYLIFDKREKKCWTLMDSKKKRWHVSSQDCIYFSLLFYTPY